MRRLTALIGCLIAFAVMPAAGYAQASATQYGGVEQEVDSGTGTGTPTPGSPPAAGDDSGAAPEGGAGGSPTSNAQAGPEGDAAAAAPESDEGTLPFTGQDLVLMVLAGVGLLGLGVALRRAARSPAV